MSERHSDVSLFLEHDIYLPRRTVAIIGEVDLDMFKTVLKSLHALDGKGKTINVIINSEGGDVTQGMAIYDALNGCKDYVRGMVFGEVSSAASFILQACDERFMSPSSYMMLHLGSENHPETHPENIKRWNEKHQKDAKWMESVYLKKIKEKKPRFTRAQLQSLLRFDTILSPQEAIDLGLADDVQEHFE